MLSALQLGEGLEQLGAAVAETGRSVYIFCTKNLAQALKRCGCGCACAAVPVQRTAQVSQSAGPEQAADMHKLKVGTTLKTKQNFLAENLLCRKPFIVSIDMYGGILEKVDFTLRDAAALKNVPLRCAFALFGCGLAFGGFEDGGVAGRGGSCQRLLRLFHGLRKLWWVPELLYLPPQTVCTCFDGHACTQIPPHKT
jgi:hypothetical protein